MANGVKLDAPKQIIIDEAQPAGARRKHTILVLQGWISDMGIDGPTFVPKSGYFLLIWVKVCPQMLAFS